LRAVPVWRPWVDRNKCAALPAWRSAAGLTQARRQPNSELHQVGCGFLAANQRSRGRPHPYGADGWRFGGVLTPRGALSGRVFFPAVISTGPGSAAWQYAHPCPEATPRRRSVCHGYRRVGRSYCGPGDFVSASYRSSATVAQNDQGAAVCRIVHLRDCSRVKHEPETCDRSGWQRCSAKRLGARRGRRTSDDLRRCRPSTRQRPGTQN
jgi:hypothetical protein